MFQVKFKTIWANFDPNRHMRHSAYSDYAAEVRARFFQEHNLSLDDFARLHIGPVLFEEQTKFLKEIQMGTDITVNMWLFAATEHFERWEFSHEVFNDQGDLSAIIKVKGAWIDLQKRKLTGLPESILEILKHIPKSEDFKKSFVKKNKGDVLKKKR